MKYLNIVLIKICVFYLLFMSCTNDPPSSKIELKSPTAKFTANPIEGKVPLLVIFDASESEDPDGNIVKYLWNFDDGTPNDSDMICEHMFEKAGTFNVSLTVFDDDGLSNSESQTIIAKEPIFPFYPGSKWIYDVEVYRKFGHKTSGNTEYGQIEVILTEFDTISNVAHLKIDGDRYYHGEEQIPSSEFIREDQDRLQNSSFSWGLWRTVLDLYNYTWENGGMMLGIKPYPSPDMFCTLMTATVPAGAYQTYYIKSADDNWGEQYVNERWEQKWIQYINKQVGLIKTERYRFYDDLTSITWGPDILNKKLYLNAYTIIKPDGSILFGSTGLIIPLISRTSPIDGSYALISYDPSVEIWFIVEMDRSSVESAFSAYIIVRDLKMQLLTGYFSWENDKHLTWKPNEAYRSGTNILVSLSTQAHSITGVYLQEYFEFSFWVY